ncbi:GlxA family transcriptional regulator [Gimesia aquarii]|uniref:HTH-type transcriptional regulator CdhR n=1 Tax=Gimesia aquarii TaxID=2527964 RepID=A0A517WT17_9PLAN|nr:GlxA family transcriptional regulator [Gimesia aquarii]QDU08396.1 HTH-type transcriptional regulator CdhR [Gimesia aquarii]
MKKRRNASGKGKSRRIVFLAFPQVVLLDLAGPWEVFSLANTLTRGEKQPYNLELVSGDGSAMILASGGISMASHRTARNCRGDIDTLIVPAADLPSATKSSTRSSTILRRLSRRSHRIVSICGGAFLLAEAGLLDGKKATTHWRGTEELSARFPEVEVQADSIFVKDGNVYTSAGVTAGIDLALALVEEDLGRAMALDCARNLVVFMRRPGGQSQFSVTLESQHTERNSISELMAWAVDNPSSNLSVEAMAERVHMSLRNFSRVFRSEVGQTPAAFVEKLRVEAARRHLEETDQSLDEIATSCGFGSADSMRRSFHRVVKVAPSDYRRRFCQQ